MLGLTRYQWLVLFAAWLGWGFDVFDGLLFNFVAPICIPNLLGISPNDPDIRKVIFPYTAGLTSLLLVGWAIGGILFGKITDRLGRTRTLLLTMLTYALATAACAFALRSSTTPSPGSSRSSPRIRISRGAPFSSPASSRPSLRS